MCQGDSCAAGEKSRLHQIVEWFGRDYDGVIVFDEVRAALTMRLYLSLAFVLAPCIAGVWIVMLAAVSHP